MMNNLLLIACLSLIILSCAAPLNTADAVPAVLTETNKAVLDELETEIASLVNQEGLVLSSDIFTKNSVITLNNRAHILSNGQLVNGRVVNKPLQIQLVTINEQCFVKNLATQVKRPLRLTGCHTLSNR